MQIYARLPWYRHLLPSPGTPLRVHNGTAVVVQKSDTERELTYRTVRKAYHLSGCPIHRINALKGVLDEVRDFRRHNWHRTTAYYAVVEGQKVLLILSEPYIDGGTDIFRDNGLIYSRILDDWCIKNGFSYALSKQWVVRNVSASLAVELMIPCLPQTIQIDTTMHERMRLKELGYELPSDRTA